MIMSAIWLHITALYALNTIWKLLQALYYIRTMRRYQRFLITLIAAAFFLSVVSIRKTLFFGDEHRQLHQTLDFIIEFGRIFVNTDTMTNNLFGNAPPSILILATITCGITSSFTAFAVPALELEETEVWIVMSIIINLIWDITIVILDHYRDDTDISPIPISSYLLPFSISRAIVRTAEHIFSYGFPQYFKIEEVRAGFEIAKLMVVALFGLKMREFVMGEGEEVRVDVEE